ncbi:MAG: TIGR03619 family F420-dependent LLM class oxidoreductase [Trebonia sp.]
MEFWLGTAFTGTEELVPLARAADASGYHAIAVPDRLFFAEYKSVHPYTESGVPAFTSQAHWPDPWVAIGAMAALTQRLRLATKIYVAPARDLFTVAKAVSTAAVLSQGRVVFGAGAGWCADEFGQTGQDFRTRNRRLDEMIPALRALWQGGETEFHGDFYDFGPLAICPVPSAPVPVYLGGDSESALERAARLGDGWIGARAYTEDQLEDVLEILTRHLAAHGRTLDDLTVMAPIASRPSAALYQKWEERGVNATQALPWAMAPRDGDGSGTDHKIASMERFAEDVIAKM